MLAAEAILEKRTRTAVCGVPTALHMGRHGALLRGGLKEAAAEAAPPQLDLHAPGVGRRPHIAWALTGPANPNVLHGALIGARPPR
jgi:hypothetical protein